MDTPEKGKPLTLCYHRSLLTLSAKASCGVPFAQTGLGDLLL